MPRRSHLLAVLLLLGAPVMAKANDMPEEWPDSIRVVLDNTAPLKASRGRRLPLYLWPAAVEETLTDSRAEALVRELQRRGIGLISRWDHSDMAASLARALPVARAQKKLGEPISIDASRCLYSFFDGDRNTAHIDEAGTPFWDTSFGKPDMGCPFALHHRREPIRQRIDAFAEAYAKEGLSPGFVFADWEIDGPIPWNEAWSASKRCRRCRQQIPDIDNFLAFQKTLVDLRADLQRDVYAEPLRRRFPNVLVGNYGVYPGDGLRYWYDYFEREETWYPGIRDQRALYRHWADEFTRSGYTFAMPVVYTWSRMWRWYEYANDDFRWFRPMLLAATNAARHTPASAPVIAFVHWHTTAPPDPPDPEVKQMSARAYQELLWHMLLRGVDTFFLWCPAEESPQEIRLLHAVWAEAQRYGDFLDRGVPVSYDVPDKPGTVISGLLWNQRLLIRRTDFTGEAAPVTLRIHGAEITVHRADGCQELTLPGDRPSQPGELR